MRLSLFDVTNGNGNWDLNALSALIPPTLLNRISPIPAPMEGDGPDRIGWCGDSRLLFSTKSAYDYLDNDNILIVGNWKAIWKWRGPHRIQTFMWIVAHGRLLTNARRHKWKANTSPICQACNQVEETQMHALRDCIFATRNWLRVLPSCHVAAFFEADDNRWVFDNLTSTGTTYQGHNWRTTFMVTTWFLWQWRNKSIFEEGYQRPNNEVEVILKFVDEITNNGNMDQANYRDDIALVKWRQPEDGWIKLNSDGACRGEDNYSGCGGLFRDSRGKWIFGYTRRLGKSIALQAEMWGLWIGILLARQRGISRLLVESDSKVLVDMLTRRGAETDVHFSLARRIKRLLTGDWEIRINHTLREGNMCADWLATLSLQTDSLDTIIYEEPPGELSHLMIDDMAGAPVPRNIRTRC